MADREHKKKSLWKRLYHFFWIAVGAGFASVAIELFLVPNSLIDGGVIGVSLILDHLLSDKFPFISFGVLVLLLNIPFMYSGYKQIGKTFVISTLFGIVSLAVIESFLHNIEPLTDEPILGAVFGGLLLGIGVGLVIRHGGSLDGTEILGIILTKKIPFSVGEFVMFINIFIFGWAAFVFSPESAMYSVMAYYIAYKLIDVVVQGLEETKAAIIVSESFGEISDAIQQRLGRGTTKLRGKGGFTDNEKDVIYVVVTRLEVTKLKELVYEIDPKAFFTIMDTFETKGGQFKSAIH